jgi:hypothetical protein
MASLPPLMSIPDEAVCERPMKGPSRRFFPALVRKDRTPPRIFGRNETANARGGEDSSNSVGEMRESLDCSSDGDDPASNFDKAGLSIKSYAIYHDEIVTALIDEALRKGDDETHVADDQHAAEVTSGSPHRTKHNTSKQLGMGSPIVSKLLKRSRSDMTGGGEDKKHLLAASPPRQKSLSSNSRTKNDPSCFFHRDCVLQKEIESDIQMPKIGFGLPISKGKSSGGVPSAMGREDTLSKLQKKLAMLGDIESGKYGMAAEMLRSDAVAFVMQVDSNNDSTKKNKSHGTKVETRSILTLRMGFVSMSYGILLQWDCRTQLVELIVLRKMCRGDFLKGKGDGDHSAIEYNLISGSQRNLQTKVPFIPPKPALIPAPLANVGPTEVSLDSTSPPDFLQNASLRTNPLAGIPMFLSGASSSKPEYLLSVSVLRVTGLFAVCDNCRNSNSDERAAQNRTVRPFIRFSLGKHEHCTRVTLLNNGNAKWSHRHHNSCLLPCPPEGLRWFAGREDLIVEVHNDWINLRRSGKNGSSKKRQQKFFMFGANSGEQASPHKDRPILAAVKVPLSSVNIEDDDDISDGGGTWKHIFQDDSASSTKITLPLRMHCCSRAPMGSITLKITMKVPPHGGRANSSPNSHALSKPNNQEVMNESIELGPLTTILDGLSFGGSARETKDAVKTKSRKKRKRLRWSKRFDLHTKRWSNLSPTSSSLKEEGGEGTLGWFTFLNTK